MKERLVKFPLFWIPVVVLTSGVWAQVDMLPPNSMRNCIDCHLQWDESFERPQGIMLIDKPPRPVEAQSATCLGCHDGSAADSRRRVWREHGHQVGVKPPDDMNVPEILPLEDGQIVCRTCHTAHLTDPTTDATVESVASQVFLRVPHQSSELCQLCHADKNKTPEQGTHPITGMAEPIPPAIVEAGAKVKADQREVHCQVCHGAHGTREEQLLVMPINNNDLCMTCHRTIRPGMWHEERAGVHPERPVIHSSLQRDAIQTMGTRLGDENRLICLSCHRMHDGKSGRFLLAVTMEESRLCITCHPGEQMIAETKHNSPPLTEEQQKHLGLTAGQNGPCNLCHMFHRAVLEPHPTAADPVGMCTNCHEQNGLADSGQWQGRHLSNSHPLNVPLAESMTDSQLPLMGPAVHPSDDSVMACRTCHEPHGKGTYAMFLRMGSADLCENCHTGMLGQMTDGAHDMSRAGADCPGTVPRENSCYACHKTHTWNDDTRLWTFGPAPQQAADDDVCIGCHQDIHWPASDLLSPLMVTHPKASPASSGQNPHEIPLRKSTAQVTGCKSCHDPHASVQNEFLLRKPDGAGKETACFTCHDQMQGINHSMHSDCVFSDAQSGNADRVCGPCHAVHAVAESTPHRLWAGPMSDRGKLPSEKRCLGCHGPEGSARPVTVVQHPETKLTHTPVTEWIDAMTLAEKDDLIDQITCLTCHITHGSPVGDRSETPCDRNQRSLSILGASKPMLRSHTADQLCAQCHGIDAARLYLYYHYPNKR